MIWAVAAGAGKECSFGIGRVPTWVDLMIAALGILTERPGLVGVMLPGILVRLTKWPVAPVSKTSVGGREEDSETFRKGLLTLC